MPNNLNIKIIYFAFTIAPLVYLFVGYQTLTQKGGTFSFNFTELIATPFVYYFVGSVVVVTVISNYLGRLAENMGNDMQQAITFSFIRFAVIEFLAVVGLVLFFTTKNFSQFIAFIAVAFILMLFAYPKQKAL